MRKLMPRLAFVLIAISAASAGAWVYAWFVRIAPAMPNTLAASWLPWIIGVLWYVLPFVATRAAASVVPAFRAYSTAGASVGALATAVTGLLLAGGFEGGGTWTTPEALSGMFIAAVGGVGVSWVGSHLGGGAPRDHVTPQPVTLATFLWLGLLLPASIAFSLWLSLPWQATLPEEDGLGFPQVLAFWVVGGLLIGLIRGRTGWTTRKRILCFVALLPLLPTMLLWVFAFVSLPVMAILGGGGYLAGRWLGRFEPTAWRIPLVVALCPIVLVLASSQPFLDQFKWLWPWCTLRPRIIAFQTSAGVAADRLQIPRNVKLSPEQLAAWKKESPLRQKLAIPMTGKSVTVSVVDPWTSTRYDDGMVWMWWGDDKDPTFGPLNVTWMEVLSASD